MASVLTNVSTAGSHMTGATGTTATTTLSNNKNNPGVATLVGGIEEVSGMHCPAISTLDKQYERPLGQRLLLFVRANENCGLQGGVETILKLQKSNRAASRANSKLTPSNSGGNLSNMANMNSTDPFEYPQDTDQYSEYSQQDPYSNANAINDGKKKQPNIGRFLKKVAKQTTATLERGMQELAIKADQGRSPDLLTACLFHQQELIAMTDSRPMPRLAASGVSFAIPLYIPGTIDDSANVTVKLFIHSQASLITTTVTGGKTKTKHFLLGQTQLSIGSLRQLLLQQRKGVFALNLTSNLIDQGQLHFCILPDPKLPALQERGWSLSDPRFSGFASAYNVPLDQSYLLNANTQKQQWLVATERAMESTLVLPIASAYARTCAKACQVSVNHAQTIATHLLAKRTEQKDPGHCAKVQVDLQCISLDANAPVSPNVASSTLTLAWQPPDSIFELELLPAITVPIQFGGGANNNSNFNAQQQQQQQTLQFYPPLCTTGILPAILKAYGGRLPAPGYLLGNLRMQIPIPTASSKQEYWEAMIVLEQHVQQEKTTNLQIPVYSLTTGHKMGSLFLSLAIQIQTPAAALPPFVSPQQGLVALVGLDNLIEGVTPLVDFMEDGNQESKSNGQQTEERKRRQQQLATMGSCMSHAYLDQHVRSRRQMDLERFQERAQQYQAALNKSIHNNTTSSSANIPGGGGENYSNMVDSWADMSPRPFRPSSSRPEVLLSGIPFNTHNASWSLEIVDPNNPNPQPDGALFHNITCGAPADHASGYSNVFLDKTFQSPIGQVSGGLRRLEAKRFELAQVLRNAQTQLIAGVATFFQSARQQQKYLNHVPARHSTLQNLRWKVFEAFHAYHHVTWICAVRRASAFSQALGIAVTSYLTALSDVAKCQLGWPDLWARHGYLVSYEGLLSAAGKELGMIEDASVAISMLHMVRVVLVPDDGTTNRNNNPSVVDRIVVPHSPILQWVQLTPSLVNGSQSQYLLEIGVHPHYYQQRIPPSLKNGTPVKLFPVLFQVGVDIRQWGAHAGSHVKNQFDVKNQFAGDKDGTSGGGAGLLDDEDDDCGVTDDDVLVALNYEALQKMNAYAHLISPLPGTAPSSTGNPFDAYVQPSGQTSQQQVSGMSVHPSLKMLHGHIVTSAGKMNHSILDEAATMAQQLGGGGVVFCKSGKDRTAMHLTYKQAQFANRFRQQRFNTQEVMDTTLEDATRMRVYGTRLPICEKNVGQALYAFNSLQSKFMPDALKPPPSTLAGFLKGGRVFGQGGIES